MLYGKIWPKILVSKPPLLVRAIKIIHRPYGCSSWTVRLNRTAYCHKRTYICNFNGLKDCPIRHRVDIGNSAQNISQKLGTSARDFCSSYLIEKTWVEFVSFRRANVPSFARTLMSVGRTIQPHGPLSRTSGSAPFSPLSVSSRLHGRNP